MYKTYKQNTICSGTLVIVTSLLLSMYLVCSISTK